MTYVRQNSVLLATREDTIADHPVFVAQFQKRIGDTIYECGGYGKTQSQAIVVAYEKWRDYWSKPDVVTERGGNDDE